MIELKQTNRKASYDLDITNLERCVEFIHIYRNGKRIGMLAFWNLPKDKEIKLNTWENEAC